MSRNKVLMKHEDLEKKESLCAFSKIYLEVTTMENSIEIP